MTETRRQPPPAARSEDRDEAVSTEAAEPSAYPPSRWGLDDGDVSLVLSTLRLTPAERIRAAEDFQRGIEALRRARRSK